MMMFRHSYLLPEFYNHMKADSLKSRERGEKSERRLER